MRIVSSLLIFVLNGCGDKKARNGPPNPIQTDEGLKESETNAYFNSPPTTSTKKPADTERSKPPTPATLSGGNGGAISKQLAGYGEIFELGRGSAAQVFSARRKSDGLEVAIKRNGNIGKGEREVEALNSVSHFDKFPKVFESFTNGGAHYIVQTRLGPTVVDIKKRYGDKALSLSLVGAIALQMVDRMEQLHSVGFVHLDMYPNNIAFELPAMKHIYLIDFGEALPLGKTRDEKTKQFDVRSLSHSVLQLLKPHTIFGDYKHFEDARISLAEMCAGLPHSVLKLFRYSHESMGVSDEPDYQYIRTILREELNPGYTGVIIL